MARVIVRRVRQELAAIRYASQAVKRLLRGVLESIEESPAAFPELEEVPERIRAITGVTIRKAKVTHEAHDSRLVYLHFRPEAGEEWVEVVYAVAQARKEVLASSEQTISLTAEEQLAFWTALSETPKLTPAQKRLGKVMRGRS